MAGLTPGTKKQFTPAEIAKLRGAIGDHLRTNDVFTQIRGFVKDFMQEGGAGATKEEALQVLQEKGVLDQVMKSFNNAGTLRAPADIPQPPAITPSHRHLHIRVSKGRGFVCHLDGAPTEGDRLALSLQVLGQRHLSSPVEASVEPVFDESFLVDLQRLAGGPMGGPPVALRQVLQAAEPLRISCIRVGAEGRDGVLLGRASVDWRMLLQRGGKGPASVELLGVGQESGIVVGALDVGLAVLPVPGPLEVLDPALVRDQARLEGGLRAEALTTFIARAKRWWADYTALHPTFRNRAVKVLARGEEGEQAPVCSFVRPLNGGRLIPSPREAARMVALLSVQEDPPVGGGGHEVWGEVHTVLTRGGGAREEHALLLCSLLLGFGLDAYVCIGTGPTGGQAWVLTRASKRRAVHWDPLTGRRYGESEALSVDESPYESIGCVFNHVGIYASIHEDDSLMAASMELENPSLWHPLHAAEQVQALSRWLPPGVRAGMVDAHAEEERLEGELRVLLDKWRAAALLARGHPADCIWDDGLSHLLMSALSAYEYQALTDIAPGNDDFQQSIKRAVPTGHTFKGFPHNFKHRSATRIAAALTSLPVPAEILSTVGQHVRLALRVRVTVYPEDICSVWVMLAVKFQGIEGTD